MQLPDRIKSIRKENKLSQLKFSEVLGISRGHVSKIETGSATPSNQLIKLISMKFDVNEDWLKSGRGECDEDESRVGMWCVSDKDGEIVAYILVEDEADCFQEVYYRDGRVEFRAITVMETEDE
jgi:transcriptional regulator with XRE-family HTH domain